MAGAPVGLMMGNHRIVVALPPLLAAALAGNDPVADGSAASALPSARYDPLAAISGQIARRHLPIFAGRAHKPAMADPHRPAATLYHYPRCSKSRAALALLEAAGAHVTIIDYLAQPPSAAELARLYARAGMTAAQGLRHSEPGAVALAGADEATILATMAAEPILIERPLVETDRGVVLARPPERVSEIL